MEISNMLPGIALILPKLEEICDVLTDDRFTREITRYTQELCENDPSLADILLDGEKTLPRCLRYVKEQAQKRVAISLEATLEDDMKQLEEIKIHGVLARMAGSAIDREKCFDWAREYYYGGDKVEPKKASRSLSNNSNEKKTDNSKNTKKDNTRKKKKSDSTRKDKSISGTVEEKTKDASDDAENLQITFANYSEHIKAGDDMSAA